ncbi:MAG: lip2 [Verrucomicrobiaceae bacterium]|nr:lip2 [Verrucomicrobiaceae bacterium]
MKLFCLLLFSATVAIAADSKPVVFPEDIRVEANIAYLPEGRSEKADLYLPQEFPKDKKLPAVVIIHGGGFVGGVKDAAREINIGSNLVRNGYVALSIEYLLAKEGKPSWPQNLYDCKTAVRWLRANADKYHIDAAHIGVIGGSAGGHLAAMVALTGPDAGLDPKEPYGSLSCQVQCGVDLYGPNDLTLWMKDSKMIGRSIKEALEEYRKASPVFQVTKDDPPMLMMHGTADTTVDPEQSKLLDAALAKAGVEHQLEIIEGAPHTFHLEPKQKDLRPIVIGFLEKHLKK